MNTKYIVKKLNFQLDAYQEEISHYRNMRELAESADGRIVYDNEVTYWKGQYDATLSAIAIIEKAEVTGGTPF
jgi:hypothetical protein